MENYRLVYYCSIFTFILVFTITSYIIEQKYRIRVIKKIQEYLKSNKYHARYDCDKFPIWISSPDHHSSIFKKGGYEEVGFIRIDKKNYTLLTKHLGEILHTVIPRKRADVVWEGKAFWFDRTHWIKLVLDRREYYISAEPGYTFIRSKSKTRRIYDCMVR